MKINKLWSNVLLISNYISEINLYLLKNYVNNNIIFDFKNTHIYRCKTYKLNNLDFYYFWKLVNFYFLNNLINKIFKCNLNITNIWEIVKMTEWDFLSIHTDSFHKLQWVLYLSDIKKVNWWEFYINDKLYYPNFWDIIIFNWSTPHKVLKVINGVRISVTFWFK